MALQGNTTALGYHVDRLIRDAAAERHAGRVLNVQERETRAVKLGTLMEGSKLGFQMGNGAPDDDGPQGYIQHAASARHHPESSLALGAPYQGKGWSGRAKFAGPLSRLTDLYRRKEKNKHAHKKLRAGRGTVGKATALLVPTTAKCERRRGQGNGADATPGGLIQRGRISEGCVRASHRQAVRCSS